MTYDQYFKTFTCESTINGIDSLVKDRRISIGSADKLRTMINRANRGNYWNTPVIPYGPTMGQVRTTIIYHLIRLQALNFQIIREKQNYAITSKELLEFLHRADLHMYHALGVDTLLSLNALLLATVTIQCFHAGKTAELKNLLKKESFDSKRDEIRFFRGTQDYFNENTKLLKNESMLIRDFRWLDLSNPSAQSSTKVAN